MESCKMSSSKYKGKQFKKKLQQQKTKRNLNKFGRGSWKSNDNSNGYDKPKFKKPSAFQRAMAEHQRIKEENDKKREEYKTKKEEMNKALEKYKERKNQRFKKMSRKTKKGQPVMKYWMEDILEKIKNGAA